MYAQVCTRPDIAFIVGVLGRYLSNPGMQHWKSTKRVMRYLRRTKYYMLTYWRSDSLEIIGFSDSDFVGCQDNRRSTSSYIFMLGEGGISWKSAKQTLIASSTIVAEFIACFEASNHEICFKKRVQDRQISIEHIGTDSMLADPLTKGLTPKNFGKISLKTKEGQVGNTHVSYHIACNFHATHPYLVYVIECISMVIIVV
ncbi:secreted RxLR effector protein 161-like [Aristolochia californica]|uniref:secreted RxLR effector protein 161-like n=1 Tax=Aristolochia californica TaxID=171875 RepID=UPI0035DA3E52